MKRGKQGVNITSEISKISETVTFKGLPKGGRVERTPAWLDTNRISAQHEEHCNDTAMDMGRQLLYVVESSVFRQPLRGVLFNR